MLNFEEIYRQHAAAVFRFAMSLTRSRETAEDLTSDAFIALHRELAGIDSSQLPAWLITVVRNRVRDIWRHRLVEERYARLNGHRQLERPPVAPPLEDWILECGDLKPVHRVCLMLRYGSDMTRSEISAKTGLSETQVKGHLQYALTLLRRTHVESTK